MTLDLSHGCDRPFRAWMLGRVFFVLVPVFLSGCGVFDKGVSRTKDTASPKMRLPAPSNIIPPPSKMIDEPKPSAFGSTSGQPDYGSASPIGTPPRATNPAIMTPTPSPSPTVYNPTRVEPIVVPAMPTMPTPPPMPVSGTGTSYEPQAPIAPAMPVTLPKEGPIPPPPAVGAPPER